MFSITKKNYSTGRPALLTFAALALFAMAGMPLPSATAYEAPAPCGGLANCVPDPCEYVAGPPCDPIEPIDICQYTNAPPCGPTPCQTLTGCIPPVCEALNVYPCAPPPCGGLLNCIPDLCDMWTGPPCDPIVVCEAQLQDCVANLIDGGLICFSGGVPFIGNTCPTDEAADCIRDPASITCTDYIPCSQGCSVDLCDVSAVFCPFTPCNPLNLVDTCTRGYVCTDRDTFTFRVCAIADVRQGCAGVAAGFGTGGFAVVDCAWADLVDDIQACNSLRYGSFYVAEVLVCVTYDDEAQCAYVDSNQFAFVLNPICVPDLDQDDDNIADAVEGQICGRQVVRDQVNTEDVPGNCDSSSNYTADQTGVTYFMPAHVKRGADADGDGVPSGLGIYGEGCTLLVPAATTTCTTASPVLVPIDPDDADPNNPVPYDDLQAAVDEAVATVEETVATVEQVAAETIATLQQTVDDTVALLNQKVEETLILVDQTVTEVQETVDETYDSIDADGDGVADEAEPTLCMVEDQNDPIDGTCTESDYHPTSIPL